MSKMAVWAGALLVATAFFAFSQSPSQKNGCPDDPAAPALPQSVKGADLFRAYCASCHGSDAKGRGPAAKALKAKVPDLTKISERNKGTFPEAKISNIISGEKNIAAHGSREMPVWGPVFHQIERDQDWGNVRLHNLVEYLKSLQPVAKVRNPAPQGTSGKGQSGANQLR